MDRNELLLMGLLLAAILLGLGVKQLSRGPDIEPVVIEAPQRLGPHPAPTARVSPDSAPATVLHQFRPSSAAASGDERLTDINQATPIELESVAGIGPVLSREIISYRSAHGPFRTMDDLLQVAGIGPSRLQKLKEAFTVAGQSAPEQTPRIPAPLLAFPPRQFSFAEPIELNHAEADELETLPDIGPVLAQRIIDHRRQHGPFTRSEQIMEVPGIGPKRFEKMAGRIYVDPYAAPFQAEAAPDRPRTSPAFGSTSSSGPAKVGTDSQDKIDLNHASREQLESLPGIGPVLAERILDYRQRRGGFQSPEEVKNISGIGEKKYEQIRPLIEISW